MANNVEVTGLKMNVQATNLARTKQQLDAVKKSLTALKIPDSKVNSIVNLAKGVSQFVNAVNKIDASKIDAFSQSIKGLGEVKIAPSVTKRINELGDAIKNVNVRELGTAAAKVNAALEPLSKTMERISISAKDLGLGSRFGKNVANMEAALLEQQEKRASEKGQKGEDVEDAKSKMDQFKEAARATAEQVNEVFANTKVGQIYTAFDNARQAANYFKQELMNTKAGQFFMEMKEKADRAFNAIKQGAQKALNAIKKLGSAVAQYAVKGLGMLSFMNPFKGIANSVSNVAKKLKTLGSSLARIAMYRALRSAIKEISKAIREGLNNLYQWSKATGGDFAPAVDKLATAMLYLKNSFGAAVSPLVTYFAPAIDLATDKLVDLLNVINQIFARLTGRATWTRALKYPTEFAESAAGATKKVKDNIQDFDELHILRTNDGGGGASGQDYSKMFEETEFSQGLTDWIQELKENIQNGKWYEAGKVLADEINKLVNNINWKKIGSDLGDKITSAFQFAFGFLKNINFDKIGSSIADFLNSAIEHVDANLVGQTFARKWTMIIDTLYGFVTTFDFPAFGWKVSEFVEGWFDEIDGYRIGQTITYAIEGALDAVDTFLSNDAMLDKMAEDIAGLINGIDWYGIFIRVLNVGAKIAKALGDIILGAVTGTGTGAGGNNASGYDMDRISASAPDAIAQRVQNSIDNSRTDFGSKLVGGMTDSINNVNTGSLETAINNLMKSLGDMLIKAVYALGQTIGVKFWEGVSDNILGGHYNEKGDWVEAFDPTQDPSLARTLGQYSGFGGGVGLGVSNARTSIQATRDYANNTRSSSSVRQDAATNTLAEIAGAAAYTSIPLLNTARALGLVKSSADRADKSIISLSKSSKSFGENGSKAIAVQKTGFADLKNIVVDGAKGMESSFDSFSSKMNGEVVSKVMQSKNNISATITSLVDDTKFKVDDMSNSIYASIDNTDKAVATPLSSIRNQITTTFKEAGSDAAESIKDLGNTMNSSLKGVVDASKGHLEGYNDLWSQLKNNVRGVSNSVIEGSEKMGNGVTDAFNKILDNLNNFKIVTPDGYKFDYNLKHIDKISIPRLATGGIATSPTTALIGEAGKEAVLPLENNTGWMDMLAERIGADGEELAVLREQNDLLRQIAAKNVTISSREVFDAVRNENDEYVTRTGRSALAL